MDPVEERSCVTGRKSKPLAFGNVVLTWLWPSLAYWCLVGAGQEEPGGRLVSRRAKKPREINYNCWALSNGLFNFEIDSSEIFLCKKSSLQFLSRLMWNRTCSVDPWNSLCRCRHSRAAGVNPAQWPFSAHPGADVTLVSPATWAPRPPSPAVLTARGGCIPTPVPQKENFHSHSICQPLETGCYFQILNEEITC